MRLSESVEYGNSDQTETIDYKEPGMDQRITEILEGIKIFDGEYKRDLIDQAVELKTEITPHLITILETVRDNPGSYLENDAYFDHNYALMLLAQFKEPKAHDVIVDLAGLPNDIPYQLFGDTITEDLPMILVRTCDGSLERVRELILNREADDFCRLSASQALVYAVVERYEQRENVLAFLCGLFTGTETSIDSDFWGLLGMHVQDLYPEEYMETIKNAYEIGLISPGMVGYDSFNKTLKAGKEEALATLDKNYQSHAMDDIHKSMSWWACFDQDESDLADTALPSHALNQTKSLKKQKKKKKKKRKMAKKSKRKNR